MCSTWTLFGEKCSQWKKLKIFYFHNVWFVTPSDHVRKRPALQPLHCQLQPAALHAGILKSALLASLWVCFRWLVGSHGAVIWRPEPMVRFLARCSRAVRCFSSDSSRRCSVHCLTERIGSTIRPLRNEQTHVMCTNDDFTWNLVYYPLTSVNDMEIIKDWSYTHLIFLFLNRLPWHNFKTTFCRLACGLLMSRVYFLMRQGILFSVYILHDQKIPLFCISKLTESFKVSSLNEHLKHLKHHFENGCWLPI